MRHVVSEKQQLRKLILIVCENSQAHTRAHYGHIKRDLGNCSSIIIILNNKGLCGEKGPSTLAELEAI